MNLQCRLCQLYGGGKYRGGVRRNDCRLVAGACRRPMVYLDRLRQIWLSSTAFLLVFDEVICCCANGSEFRCQAFA